MKNIKFKPLHKILLLGMVLILTLGCERDLTEDAVEASFPAVAEIFTDDFVGLGSDFYFPYSDGYAKPDVFEVDNNVSYEGSASLRIDVPNANDPEGTYAGAYFRIDGAGRNLTGYNALTFWVKSTGAPVIESFGFGQSETADYQVSISNLQLSTSWKKIIIPIPDASKLVEEKGMFWLVALPDEGDGYSFWIDELKFENLGTIGQPRPVILGGVEGDFISVPGQTFTISSFNQTFNLGNGQDVTVNTSANYFSFSSTDTSVASVNEQGIISVLSTGEAQITASVRGVTAQGLVNVRSFDEPRIISIFSDFYANVPVDNYNGFYEPYQTTLGGKVDEGGNNVITYTDLNFVAIEFYGRDNSGNSPIDASQMTNLNIDFRPNEPVSPTDYITIRLINNFGPSQTSGEYTITGAELQTGQWSSFNIPLANFNGLAQKDALGAMLFVTDGTIRNLSIDNIYFSKEVIEPLPNVDDSAATQFTMPVGFESSTLNYNFIGFEGAESSAIVANPVSGGINPTANVMTVTKVNGAQTYAGTLFDFDQTIDFSSSQKIRLKVYSPKANITVRMAIELNGGGAQQVVDATIPEANEWVELEFDFAGVYNSGVNYGRIVIFMDFGATGDGTTYFFDDIQIKN